MSEPLRTLAHVPGKAGHIYFKYVISDVDRNGNRRWYLRVPRQRKIRLPCGPHEPGFTAAYNQSIAGKAQPNPRYFRKDKKPQHAFKIGEAMEYGLKKARHRAKELGREFDLTIDWCLQRIEEQHYCCAVSGVPFFHKPKGSSKCNPYAPSIDRIDCSRGYTQDNSRIVLFAVNVMLFDWGEDVLRTVAESYWVTRREHI